MSTNTIEKEKMDEQQSYAAEFLGEDKIVVDNSVNMSNENYISDDDEQTDDGEQQNFTDDDLANLENQGNTNNNNDGLTDDELAKKNAEKQKALDDELANKKKSTDNNVDPNDLTDDDLFGLVGKKKEEETPAPVEFNSPIEVANYLGVKIEGKKPEEITFADVKAEIENVKKLATESDLTEVKQIKSFLSENKGATEIDYFDKFISPLESLKYFGDKELMMFKFTNVDKKTSEEAEKLVDNMIFDNSFEKAAKDFRSIVNAKNAEFYEKRNLDLEAARVKAENQKIENKQNLMTALHQNKSSFIGGELVLKNSDIKEIFEDVVSGKVHEQLKDHKVMGEVAWFLKNKAELIKVLKSEGSNTARMELFNKIANATQKLNVRGETPTSKDEMKTDGNDWL